MDAPAVAVSALAGLLVGWFVVVPVVERIPEPKEKYDPWAVTKPADPARKPK